jgi:hypothetical protein
MNDGFLAFVKRGHLCSQKGPFIDSGVERSQYPGLNKNRARSWTFQELRMLPAVPKERLDLANLRSDRFAHFHALAGVMPVLEIAVALAHGAA